MGKQQVRWSKTEFPFDVHDEKGEVILSGGFDLLTVEGPEMRLTVLGYGEADALVVVEGVAELGLTPAEAIAEITGLPKVLYGKRGVFKQSDLLGPGAVWFHPPTYWHAVFNIWTEGLEPQD